jgi:hypothetical protein
MKIKLGLLRMLFILFAMGFLTFIIVRIIAGGDAVNGKIENGHYYFGDRGDKYTEVSRTAYVVSAGLVTVWATFLTLAFVLSFLSLCSPILRGIGIFGLGILLVFAVFCAGAFALLLISLRCILHAYGIM